MDCSFTFLETDKKPIMLDPFGLLQCMGHGAAFGDFLETSVSTVVCVCWLTSFE